MVGAAVGAGDVGDPQAPQMSGQEVGTPGVGVTKAQKAAEQKMASSQGAPDVGATVVGAKVGTSVGAAVVGVSVGENVRSGLQVVRLKISSTTVVRSAKDPTVMIFSSGSAEFTTLYSAVDGTPTPNAKMSTDLAVSDDRAAASATVSDAPPSVTTRMTGAVARKPCATFRTALSAVCSAAPMLVSEPDTWVSDCNSPSTPPFVLWSLRSKSIRGVDPNVMEPTWARVGPIWNELTSVSAKTLSALNDELPMLLDPSRTKTKST